MRELLINLLTKILEYLIICSMVCMVFLQSINVLLRYVFNYPLTWAEEVSILLMIWVVFCAAGLLQKQQGHVSLSYAYDFFPKRMKSICAMFGNICVCVILIIHLISSIYLVRIQSKTSTPALRFPMSLFSIAVLIGIASMLIYTLNMILASIKNKIGSKSSINRGEERK